MITLFGATGYTGRLVAEELALQNIPFRLAGRSPTRLAKLADSLPGSPSWLVADATQPNTLPSLFQDTRILVNCAGPFTDLAEPLVAQAALNGVHYLDTSNELGYVYRMWGYDALARRCGAAILPACGFEVALADCAAAVLAMDMESKALDEISVVYDLHGRGSSFGSRRSAVRALATSWLGYEEGHWVPTIPCHETRRIQLAGIRLAALSFPSSEIATVPHHLPVRQVTTWLVVSWHALFWAPTLMPIFAWLARGPVGKVVSAIVSSVSAPPETGLRSQAPFTIQVVARQGDTSKTLTLSGQGVYDLTAKIVVFAAGQLAQPGYSRSGVLAAAAALDPEALLDQAVARWQIGTSREPVNA
jgi:short subunit dehydrogenase-like uncharacterized protein